MTANRALAGHSHCLFGFHSGAGLRPRRFGPWLLGQSIVSSQSESGSASASILAADRLGNGGKDQVRRVLSGRRRVDNVSAEKHGGLTGAVGWSADPGVRKRSDFASRVVGTRQGPSVNRFTTVRVIALFGLYSQPQTVEEILQRLSPQSGQAPQRVVVWDRFIRGGGVSYPYIRPCNDRAALATRLPLNREVSHVHSEERRQRPFTAP